MDSLKRKPLIEEDLSNETLLLSHSDEMHNPKKSKHLTVANSQPCLGK